MTKFVCKKCKSSKMAIKGVADQHESVFFQCEECYDCTFVLADKIEFETNPNYLTQ
jgi:hypothetical protein